MKSRALLLAATLTGLMGSVSLARSSGDGATQPLLPTVRFTLTDTTAWGGQALVAPCPISCVSAAPAGVTLLAAVPAGATVLYGKFPALNKKTAALAQVRGKDGSVRVYVDGNADGALTAAEGVLLKKGGTLAPGLACEDDLTGRVAVGPRRAIVWACRAPNVVFWAWQGFLKGSVDIDGQAREAFLVDADANSKFGDESRDQVWIDTNGDGKLSPANEVFPLAPILKVSGKTYRLAYTLPKDTSKDTAVTISFARLERGIGRRKISFTPEVTGRIHSAEGTLLSQVDDVFRFSASGEEMELPATNYTISNLSLRLEGKAGQWSYSFARWVDSKADSAYPFIVTKDTTAEIKPLEKLAFTMKVQGDGTPGTSLGVKLSAKTGAGLELTNALRPGAQGYSEDYAKIALVDAGGKTVSIVGSGFA